MSRIDGVMAWRPGGGIRSGHVSPVARQLGGQSAAGRRWRHPINRRDGCKILGITAGHPFFSSPPPPAPSPLSSFLFISFSLFPSHDSYSYFSFSPFSFFFPFSSSFDLSVVSFSLSGKGVGWPFLPLAFQALSLVADSCETVQLLLAHPVHTPLPPLPSSLARGFTRIP